MLKERASKQLINTQRIPREEKKVDKYKEAVYS